MNTMQYYNVLVVGCTDPVLFGPYVSQAKQLQDARTMWQDTNYVDQECDCLFKLTIAADGEPFVFPYIGDELESQI